MDQPQVPKLALSQLENNWLIVKALVAGYAIRFLLVIFIRIPSNYDKVPLLNLMPINLWFDILTVFFIMIIFGWQKYSKYRLYWFVFALLFISYSIFNYSSTGAFSSFHVVLMLLMIVFSEQLSPDMRKYGSVLFISSIFFSAAYFKLNKSYLSGSEFLPTGDFLYWIYTFFGPHINFPQWLLTGFLPKASIAIEFGIALLFLLRAKLAIHISQIFVLILSIINPDVFSVYFSFLPIALLIEPNFFEPIKKLFNNSLFQNPFFWAIFIFAISPLKFRTTAYPYFELVFMTIFLVYQIFWLTKCKNDFSILITFKSPFFRWQILTMPLLVSLSAIAKILGAPSPLGYSMYSGLKEKNPVYKIQFLDTRICKILNQSLNKTIVTDSRLTYELNGADFSCIGHYPTLDGINVIKNRACLQDPHLSWKFMHKTSAMWIAEDCTFDQ